MPYVTKIAWRFLVHSKGQTALILAGIAIGFAVQIFVAVLIDSVQGSLFFSTLGTVPHVRILSDDNTDYIKSPTEKVQKIQTISGVTKALEVVEKNATVVDLNDAYPVIFRGVSSNSDDLYSYRPNIIQGNFIQDDREVIIGSELAKELDVGINDFMPVTSVTGGDTNFRIAGIFELGNQIVDKQQVVGEINAVRSFFGLRTNEATSIAIQVNDVLNVEPVQQAIENEITEPYIKFSNWKEENQELLNALSTQTTSSLIIQATVLASVVVAITSILSITVLQKSKQIGILKAMGLKDKDSSLIFLTSGFLLGVVGSTLGLLLGFGMFYGFITNVRNPDGTQLFTPVIKWPFVFGTWLVSVVVATAAGIFPARRSSELNPIEIIQNG